MKFILNIPLPHLYELLVEDNYCDGITVADELTGELLPEVQEVLNKYKDKSISNTDYITIEFDTKDGTGKLLAQNGEV